MKYSPFDILVDLLFAALGKTSGQRFVTLLLSAMSSISFGADPYGVTPPSGKQWTMTFDDEFTQDASINTNKWNGGAGGTDWCSLNFHGKPGGG